MQKLSLKLNKELLKNYKTSSYKNKDGVMVEQYDLELVMKNVKEIVTDGETKVLKSGDTWELIDMGFVTGKGVKQEDGKYSKEPIFGGATSIRDKKVEESEPVIPSGYEGDFNGEVANTDDIPF